MVDRIDSRLAIRCAFFDFVPEGNAESFRRRPVGFQYRDHASERLAVAGHREIPDDGQRLARPVLAHRLLPTAEAIVERHLPEQVVDRIVAQLPLSRR